MASIDIPRGSIPPVSYEPGFIVLSFFVSLAGCATTLELLHRRTSTKGLYNWFLLIAASITMGAGGIWSMHFIGQRAIVIAKNEPELQIVYNPGFTALSVFLPITVLIMAFYFLGKTSRANHLYILLAGFLTGGAVCGMHYVGDAGIANYACHYHIGHVVGAVIIAIAASLIALSVFFRLRETWTDSWWKRSLCAAVLAGAVTGMHWTAAVGTKYKAYNNGHRSSGASRVQTVIVCAVLSIGCCVLLFVVAIARGRLTRVQKKRAQQVVLACAYFDSNGRLMLTPEGSLPSQKITKQFVEKTFGEDELSRSDSTFLWIFKATRNWTVVKEMIPKMAHNLQTNANADRYAPGQSTSGTSSMTDVANEVSVSFSSIFKQLFCIAAQSLAHAIHEPLENIGLLFEEPLETGIAHLARRARGLSIGSSDLKDVEGNAVDVSIGRGKYLLLYRSLNKAESQRFATLGYRFGSIQQVYELVARNIEVDAGKMSSSLQRMRASADQENLFPSGVHLACFVLRPTIHKSFEVLVSESAHNRLPSTPLSFHEQLNDKEAQLLARYDDWMVTDILESLVTEAGRHEGLRDLYWYTHSAFTRLIDLIGDTDLMMSARFSACKIRVPCRTTLEANGESQEACTIYVIRAMNDVHSGAPEGMTYIPLSFFGTQQQIDGLDPKPSNEAFARKIRMEFGQATSTSRKSADPTSPTTIRGRQYLGPASPNGPRTFNVFRRGSKSETKASTDLRRKHSDEGKLVEVGVREVPSLTDEERSESGMGANSNTSEVELDNEGKIVVTETFSVMPEEDYERMRKAQSHMRGLESKGTGNGTQQRWSINGRQDMEMMALSPTDDPGNWVNDIFNMFRL